MLVVTLRSCDISELFWEHHNANFPYTLLMMITLDKLFIQVRVRAADEGVPPRTATAVVEVNIQRDEGELRFTAQNYAARVEENKEVGQTVTNVRAAPGVSQVFLSPVSTKLRKGGI